MKNGKKLTAAALALVLALGLLTGCDEDAAALGKSSDTQLAAQTQQESGSDASGAADAAEQNTAENTETSAAGSTAENAAEAPASDGTIVFSDAGVTGSADGWEADGTRVKITASGVYTITGACADGSVTVKKGTTGVTLILSDLTLASSEGAPLCLNKESETTVCVSGTVTLTDAEDSADEDSADAEVADAFDGAAIKVKSGAQLTITGDGVLYADGSACKNGIKGASDASITVAGATVNVKAAHNGLACDGALAVTGGTLNIQADNDAIHGETDVTLTGGTINIDAGDDAIHAEQVLTVGVRDASDGPAITVYASYEGLEAGTIYLYSGTGRITASDDGVNAATDAGVDEIAMYVYGGSWYVDAGGDGVDAGGDQIGSGVGNVYLYGGTLEVYGAANSGNSALDFDGACTADGGTLLAVGMSGMAQAPSTGVSVTFGAAGGMGGFGGMFGGQSAGGVSVAKGSSIEIRAADGSVLYSATGVRSANHVVFTSPALTEGETYTLYIDGAAAATATAAAGNGMGGFGGMMGGGMFGGRPSGDGQTPSDDQTPPDSQEGFGGQRPDGSQGGFGGQRPDGGMGGRRG